MGVTIDLARRISEHRAKLVPGFTPQDGVTLLLYFEAFDSILEAPAREHALKRWRRAWKVQLIEKLNPDWRDLSDQLNSWRRGRTRSRAPDAAQLASCCAAEPGPKVFGLEGGFRLCGATLRAAPRPGHEIKAIREEQRREQRKGGC